MSSPIPFRELRNANDFSRICHEKDEPVFVTRNGCGGMVIMSIKTYEKNMAKADLQGKLAEGEEDIRAGPLIEVGSALKIINIQHLTGMAYKDHLRRYIREELQNRSSAIKVIDDI